MLLCKYIKLICIYFKILILYVINLSDKKNDFFDYNLTNNNKY